MPTTNFSISAPTFVQFDWHGWSAGQKNDLLVAARAIPGVTGTATAGGSSSVHVTFDPAQTSQEALIAAMAEAADDIVPGHNFSGK